MHGLLATMTGEAFDAQAEPPSPHGYIAAACLAVKVVFGINFSSSQIATIISAMPSRVIFLGYLKPCTAINQGTIIFC